MNRNNGEKDPYSSRLMITKGSYYNAFYMAVSGLLKKKYTAKMF